MFFNRLAFTFVLSFSLALPVPADAGVKATVNFCARQMCLLTTGGACIPLNLLALLQAKKRGKSGEEDRSFYVTNRTPLHYLDELGLYRYDFSGKRVLDIAAGKSRFVQLVNLAYAGTGVDAHGVDLFSAPPWLAWPGVYEEGDAFHLPYPDRHFDLTLASWLWMYFLPRTGNFSRGDRGKQQERELRDLLEEQLRVTADGGELRIGLYRSTRDSEVTRFLARRLRASGRVKELRFVRNWPIGMTHLEVVLKEPNCTDEERKALPSERYLNRFSPLDSALAVGGLVVSGLILERLLP